MRVVEDEGVHLPFSRPQLRSPDIAFETTSSSSTCEYNVQIPCEYDQYKHLGNFIRHSSTHLTQLVELFVLSSVPLYLIFVFAQPTKIYNL